MTLLYIRLNIHSCYFILSLFTSSRISARVPRREVDILLFCSGEVKNICRSPVRFLVYTVTYILLFCRQNVQFIRLFTLRMNDISVKQCKCPVNTACSCVVMPMFHGSTNISKSCRYNTCTCFCTCMVNEPVPVR